MKVLNVDLKVVLLACAVLGIAPIGVNAQTTQFDNFVYVNQNVNFGAPNIVSGYGFDPNSGLVPLANSPFLTKGTGPTIGLDNEPIDIVVGRDFGYPRNPAGNFLFVSNVGSNDISVFSIDPFTGNLGSVNGSPFSTGIPPSFEHALALTPDTGTDQAGNHYRFLYSADFSGSSMANQVASSISAYRVDPNGALTFLYNRDVRATDGGSLTGPIVISPNGKFLAVSGAFCSASTTDVVIYQINDDPNGIHDGTLNKVNCFTTGTASLIAGLEFDCANSHLFASGFGADALGFFSTIGVLNIDSSGALSQASGFLKSTGASIASPILSPGDTVLTYTTEIDAEVRTFHVVPSFMEVADTSRVNSGGAQVTVKGSPYSDPGVPVGLATDEAGTLLYIANSGNQKIDVFNMAPGGFLNRAPAGSLVPIPFTLVLHVAAFPPKTCSIRETAAARAKSLLGRPYSFGAKGYDKGATPNGYTGGDTISSGYTHCNGSPNCSGTNTNAGIDCSGLVLWSYNTGDGFWQTYASPNSPVPVDGSAAQYDKAHSQFLGSDPFDPTGLEPGDLLFFDYEHGWNCDRTKTPVACTSQADPGVDHVAMFVGPTARNSNGEVIEAYSDVINPHAVIPSSCDPSAGCARATRDLNLKNIFCSNPNLPATCTAGIGTLSRCPDVKPCFAGFKRPINQNVGLWFNTHSPIGLTVTDPDGFTITPDTVIVTSREAMRIVPGQLSYVINSDDDDTVIAHTLKPGLYLVKPVPKQNASSGDTYSLTVTGAGTTLNLAQNVPISEIPDQGYAVMSTGTTISVAQSDTIPPATTATLSPQPSATGWNNQDVTVTLNATDNTDGSGVKQITYSASGTQVIASTTTNGSSASIVISTEGVTTLTFFAADNGGNIEAAKTITIKLDKTPPAITGSTSPAPNANGWNNTNVTVSFQCSDTLSGLAAGSPPAPSVLLSEGAGQSVTGECTDVAGNSASATVAGINIDKTPPTLACSASPSVLWPPNNKLVTVNLSVTVADALSGPAGFTLASITSNEPDSGQGDIQGFVTGTASISGRLRAQRLGSGIGRIYTLSYSGPDRAGNVASCTATVTVPHDQGK